MSAFLTKLVMEEVDGNLGRWLLVQPLIYQSDIAQRVITVPAGFPTDLASTPRIPVLYELFGNVAHRAAVVHDYLYTSGRESRAVADAVMREACAVTGVAGWRSWGMWVGVRLGGAAFYTPTPAGSPVENASSVPPAVAIENILY